MSKNIEINVYDGSNYEVLYPKANWNNLVNAPSIPDMPTYEVKVWIPTTTSGSTTLTFTKTLKYILLICGSKTTTVGISKRDDKFLPVLGSPDTYGQYGFQIPTIEVSYKNSAMETISLGTVINDSKTKWDGKNFIVSNDFFATNVPAGAIGFF